MRPIVEIYFYPRPPRGGRHNSLNGWATDIKFLSTPSARRATKRVTQKGGDRRFLSTPSARRATSRRAIRSLMGAYFYPRPPRGGRPTRAAATDSTEPISIHALREEGDVCAIYDISELISFLSTPSARRATCCGPRGGDSGCYFYPRPPRGGRLNTYEQRLAATGFLSTPSARRATATATSLGYSVEISIHALREEGDSSMVAVITRRVLFLSTPSARRATPTIFPYWDCRAISIHALREEGDSAFYIKSTDASDFYPRPPRGGRPVLELPLEPAVLISIHALREEGDR